jgi:FkbM family methyltransferase
MKNNYYSQYGEDKILSKIFKLHKGTCVEVGANDGVTFSNSLHFEKIGWQCVLVEPTPHLCETIKKTRKAQLFECACSSKEGESTFHYVKDHDLYSSIEENCTMATNITVENAEVIQTKVKTRTLDSILIEADVKKIDFITIDVEGHELSVLRGFNLEKWNPEIIIIEDNSDTMISEPSKLLREFGYTKFYRSGGNDWYAKHPWMILKKGNWEIKGIIKSILPLYVKKPVIDLLRKYIRK